MSDPWDTDLATLDSTINKAAYGTATTTDYIEAGAALARVGALLHQQQEWIDRVAEVSTDAATAADEAENRAVAAEAEVERLLGRASGTSARTDPRLRG